MHRRWMKVLVATFALSLLAAACGGDDGTAENGTGGGGDGTATETQGGGGGADLTIVDFSFSPSNLTVTDGDTITVANIGDTSHTFTTDDEAIDEVIAPGEEVEVPIDGVTSQGFHCEFHPSQMTGQLKVQ
jgi:plastocyanin